MTGLKFQQSNPDVHQSQPWPVVVAPDGQILHGRPDAASLIGFQHGDTQTIVVLASAAMADPTQAIGLCPVFSALGGEDPMFAVVLPVTHASGWTL